MRTTIDIDEDNLRAVEAIRAASGQGLSRVVNDLLARGLAVGDGDQPEFRQQRFAMGARLDVSNIGALLEDLDGPAHG